MYKDLKDIKVSDVIEHISNLPKEHDDTVKVLYERDSLALGINFYKGLNSLLLTNVLIALEKKGIIEYKVSYNEGCEIWVKRPGQ